MEQQCTVGLLCDNGSPRVELSASTTWSSVTHEWDETWDHGVHYSCLDTIEIFAVTTGRLDFVVIFVQPFNLFVKIYNFMFKYHPTCKIIIK